MIHHKALLMQQTLRILHYWHLVHQPFVIIMFLVLLVHVLRSRAPGVHMEILNSYHFLLWPSSPRSWWWSSASPSSSRRSARNGKRRQLVNRIIPVSSLTAADIEKIQSLHPEGKKMYPAVNRAVCIGCGACVQSCREKDVLAVIHGKSTLVNPLACRCGGDCERNCLTGG